MDLLPLPSALAGVVSLAAPKAAAGIRAEPRVAVVPREAAAQGRSRAGMEARTVVAATAGPAAATEAEMAVGLRTFCRRR